MVYTEEMRWCSDIIKQGTKNIHAATEAQLIPKLKAIKTPAGYVAVLKMFYGFFAPVEKSIAQHITASILHDMEKRKRSAFILHDLKELHDTTLLKECTDLPDITNCLQAFGALYVLEGSTLGGKIIAQMLRSNHHIHLSDACLTFFNGYGDAAMPMWNDFKATMNRVAADTAQIAVVTEAAVQTFEKFKYWIENNC